MSCEKECENCGQVGGDGYAMSMIENIAGQPVVEAYNCCDNADVPVADVADATNQLGGGVNPFNFIINPTTGARLSLFSSGGKALLKNMIRQYKTGGIETEPAKEKPKIFKDEFEVDPRMEFLEVKDVVLYKFPGKTLQFFTVEEKEGNYVTIKEIIGTEEHHNIGHKKTIDAENEIFESPFIHLAYEKETEEKMLKVFAYNLIDLERNLETASLGMIDSQLGNKSLPHEGQIYKYDAWANYVYDKHKDKPEFPDSMLKGKIEDRECSDNLTKFDVWLIKNILAKVDKNGKKVITKRDNEQQSETEIINKILCKIAESKTTSEHIKVDAAPVEAPAEASGEASETAQNAGSPAEMADAFGEDYFNTEADALRGSWD